MLLLIASVPEQGSARVAFRRSFCFASVALLAGCTYGGDVAPAASPAPTTVTVVVPAAPTPTAMAVAPARPRSCTSDADCGSSPTGGLCLPKATTRELSDAEGLLAQAMSLDDLVTRLGDTSGASPLVTMEQRVQEDMTTYGNMARGTGADQGGPLTSAQMQAMQDAAWMQSGATQADMLIRQFAFALSKSPLTTDAQKVRADITGDGAGPHLDEVLGDLPAFVKDVEVVAASMNQYTDLREADGGALSPKSGAGALQVYLGPTLKTLNDAARGLDAQLDASGTSRRKKDLASLSRAHDLVGKDGSVGTCLGWP